MAKRCDKCSTAKAVVTVHLTLGDLDFCQHHYAEYHSALLDYRITILDPATFQLESA